MIYWGDWLLREGLHSFPWALRGWGELEEVQAQQGEQLVESLAVLAVLAG